MKMKNLFFTIFWMFAFVHVHAQYNRAQMVENAPPTTLATSAYDYDTCFVRVDPSSLEERSAKSTTWIAPAASENWFISIGGGVGDLLNEEFGYISFAKRVNPSFNFSFGKWVSPTWGLRFNVTGAKLQGFVTNGWSAYPEYDPKSGWSESAINVRYDDEGRQLPPPYIGQGLWYIGKNYPYPVDKISNTSDLPLPATNETNTYLPMYYDEAFQVIKDRYFGDVGVVRGSKNGQSEWGYIYHVPYVATSVDVMLNVGHFFGASYNPRRVFDAYLYGGLGFAHTFGIDKDKTKQTDVNSVMGKGGLSLNFRLSNSASVYLDVQSMLVPEYFSWHVGDGNTMDIVMNYTVGMTFDINRRFTRAPEYRPGVTSPIKAYIPPMPPPPDNDKLYVAIQFIIDKHNVQASEMHKLEEIARYMRNNPTKKVALSGYADVETANPSYNLKLSEKRVNEVIRLLSDRYGIDSYRLNTKAFGDKVQPFRQNDRNRAVIAFDVE